MDKLNGRLRERAREIVQEFSGNVCSSRNPRGYKGIVIFGEDLGRRESLCDIIQESFPCWLEEKSYVWEDEHRGAESDILYVDAGF